MPDSRMDRSYRERGEAGTGSGLLGLPYLQEDLQGPTGSLLWTTHTSSLQLSASCNCVLFAQRNERVTALTFISLRVEGGSSEEEG